MNSNNIFTYDLKRYENEIGGVSGIRFNFVG